MGGEDGEDGGQVFDSYEDLMNTLKCREDLFEMVRKRFGHLTGVFHLNMWVDSDLWRQLSIRAHRKGITKREAVETALREVVAEIIGPQGAGVPVERKIKVD